MQYSGNEKVLHECYAMWWPQDQKQRIKATKGKETKRDLVGSKLIVLPPMISARKDSERKCRTSTKPQHRERWGAWF
ncbi:hypothetical protein LR48_Vigan08g098500 [Vigna angularis]|uniref:Uncharacterized protein n=1 Tax=Phaseolus angularis TaxID=3914 RepID=A0A0L9V5C2_PHAAN|nr:hypothetical protein LR48_Vigan08g098500 [Vigna angularis]